MSNISTVQGPTPRIEVRRAMISSSGNRAIVREGGTVPSRVRAAMSLTAAIFARDNPAPRNTASVVANNSSGLGNRRPG